MRRHTIPPATSQSAVGGPTTVFSSSKLLLKRLLKETRTRILLLYGLLLLLTTVVSVPVFRYLLFANVNARVQADLNEERENFLNTYREWEKAPEQTTQELQTFIQKHFEDVLIEDDNFHLVLIDGELFDSNPPFLIEPLRPNSDLFEQWQQINQPTIDEYGTGRPEIGSILYTADPLMLDGQSRGLFITAHSSAGERQEALVGVYLLMQIMVVVFLISLLLAWLSAGKLMAPISRLSQTARSISESDMTQRIPIPQSDGELAELTYTFNAMMDRIQAAFDSQRNFINDASHELRTPITIIQGHLELLDDDPQSRQETIEIVMDELDRMGRLVSDLLLLAKSERPNFLQLESLNVEQFLEGVFAKASALATRNWQIKLEANPVEFLGDRQKLTGALLNLLRNAVQHTQADNTIELGYCIVSGALHSAEDGPRWRSASAISASSQAAGSAPLQYQRTRENLQIWVHDNGPGMTLAEQQRVFERFARGRQHRTEGSGLGLAIADAIVEAHGGNIDLESQLTRGSTFRITLPLSKISKLSASP
ncbi:MAG: HAMP domain-containing sensor histidine kinase [Cyanobacteria bacterium J06629_19]